LIAVRGNALSKSVCGGSPTVGEVVSVLGPIKPGRVAIRGSIDVVLFGIAGVGGRVVTPIGPPKRCGSDVSARVESCDQNAPNGPSLLTVARALGEALGSVPAALDPVVPVAPAEIPELADPEPAPA
jgi:hypothetical protein